MAFEERYADVFERAIAPLWHDAFAARLFARAPQPARVMDVLDLHCASGRTTAQLAVRYPQARILGLEPNAALLGMARERLRGATEAVWVREGSLANIVEFEDAWFDLVCVHLAFDQVRERTAALRELIRILKPGGVALVSVPLHGTLAEPEGILSEVLQGTPVLAQAFAQQCERRLSARQLGQLGETAQGVPHHTLVTSDELELTFRAPSDLLASPLTEFVFIPAWTAQWPQGARKREPLAAFRRALETYYEGHVMVVTANVGVMALQAPAPEGETAALVPAYWARYPNLAGIFAQVEREQQENIAAEEGDDLALEVVVEEAPPRDPISALPSPEDLDALLNEVLLGHSERP